MASRRPLAVYSAKRRQRSISNPHARLVAPSSPLKQHGQHDTDFSVAEMSRRMMKRSRSGLGRTGSASAGASPNEPKDDCGGREDDARPAKKSRVGSETEKAKSVRVPLQTIVEPGNNEQEGDDDGMTVDMDLTSVLQLKTPAPREDTIPLIPGATHIPTPDREAPPDFLSPLPSNHSAKRVLAHRTSSTQLKENKSKVTRSPSASNADSGLLGSDSSALSLASPFNSRPGSPSRKRLGNRRASKKAAGKTLNRTRSVGTDLRRKATMRSYSRAVSPAPMEASGNTLNRHPSHPTSLSLRKDQQDWFVSPRLKQPGLVASPLERPRTPPSQAPFARETSFFSNSPQACSTPLSRNRVADLGIPPTPGFHIDLDATPRLPLTLTGTALTLNEYSHLDEPTPRARPLRAGLTLDSLLNAEDSLFPDSYLHDRPFSEKLAGPMVSAASPGNARRRRTIHLPEDSIFSSAMDLSVSVTAKQQPAPALEKAALLSSASVIGKGSSSDPPIPVPPSSPTMPASPASSEGDELRDMFSILGLDEDEHWNMTRGLLSSDVPPRTSGPGPADVKVEKKIQSSISSRMTSGKRGLPDTKHRTPPPSSVSRGLQARKQGFASPIVTRPRLRRALLPAARTDEPVQANEASADPLAGFSALSVPRLRKAKQPTIKMKIDNEPVTAGEDSVDELLLTSKGWNWDPITKQTVPTD